MKLLFGWFFENIQRLCLEAFMSSVLLRRLHLQVELSLWYIELVISCKDREKQEDTNGRSRLFVDIFCISCLRALFFSLYFPRSHDKSACVRYRYMSAIIFCQGIGLEINISCCTLPVRETATLATVVLHR